MLTRLDFFNTLFENRPTWLLAHPKEGSSETHKAHVTA